MSESREYRVRSVLDIDSIEKDPDALRTFRDLIQYLVGYDINITFGTEIPEHEIVDTIMELLHRKILVFVCYSDRSDPAQWRLEPGPELANQKFMPIDINLN